MIQPFLELMRISKFVHYHYSKQVTG